MHNTSINLPDDLYKRVNVASAAVCLSVSEYIRVSLTAALATHAEQDPAVAAHFAFLDSRELARQAELATGNAVAVTE
jgi:plasmid stability protein